MGKIGSAHALGGRQLLVVLGWCSGAGRTRNLLGAAEREWTGRRWMAAQKKRGDGGGESAEGQKRKRGREAAEKGRDEGRDDEGTDGGLGELLAGGG